MTDNQNRLQIGIVTFLVVLLVFFSREILRETWESGSSVRFIPFIMGAYAALVAAYLIVPMTEEERERDGQ